MVTSQCLVGGIESNENVQICVCFSGNVCSIDIIFRSILFKYQNNILFIFASPLLTSVVYTYTITHLLTNLETQKFTVAKGKNKHVQISI